MKLLAQQRRIIDEFKEWYRSTTGLRIVLVEGGRRSGKSVVACELGRIALESVSDPRLGIVADSTPWAHTLPLPWDGGKRTVYWSRESLKQWPFDVVMLLGADRLDRSVFGVAAPALVERGGTMILTARPPVDPRGQWVISLHQRIVAGDVEGRVFALD